MANTLKAPPGTEWYQSKPGVYQLRDLPARTSEDDTRTISFRIPRDDYARLWAFTETFPKRQWGESMRWLVTQPEVIEVMRKRRQAASRRRQPSR